jgi:hypothetical protein
MVSQTMNSKADRGAYPKNRGVRNPLYSRIDWINYAPAGTNDVLEIGLNNPAGIYLRLIGNFQREFIGADWQGFAWRTNGN